MDEMERGYLVAEYVKQVMLGIDMLLVDDENIKFLDKSISEVGKKVSIGYSFPMADYAKIDKLQAENETIKAIVALCKQRMQYKAAMELKRLTLDEKVLDILGIL